MANQRYERSQTKKNDEKQYEIGYKCQKQAEKKRKEKKTLAEFWHKKIFKNEEISWKEELSHPCKWWLWYHNETILAIFLWDQYKLNFKSTKLVHPSWLRKSVNIFKQLYSDATYQSTIIITH